MLSGFSWQYGYRHYLVAPEGAEYYQVRICRWICLPASTPTPFNPLFRQGAAVSLLRRHIALEGSNGILTVMPSESPFGLSLGPD